MTQSIVGDSAHTRQLMQLIRSIAPTAASVLINGESGAGKELIAQAIHDQSDRAGQAFVAVNCGAIPGELMESELFGHKKGSFTGAIADREGKVTAADGGTLFLDEIGDMPINLQARLLRVLAEKEVMRIGSSKTKHIDIRVICASHRNLRDLVEGGEFREDLYYRVAGITFTIPTLRERDDLKWLINRILAKQHKGQKESITTISLEAEQVLLQYKWPGNIRQLENILELAKLL